MTTKRELLHEISFHFLKEFCAQTKIIRSRGNYYKKDFVRSIGRRLTKEECEFVNEQFQADQPADAVSQRFLMNFYPDENLVRKQFHSYLVDELVGSANDEVIFNEMPISGVRSDINRFNGKSYTYELKSPRDSPARLTHQLGTYLNLFEHVYIVVPEDSDKYSVENKRVGIFTYDYPSFDFRLEMEATPATDLDPYLQLNQLRLSELRALLQDSDIKVKSITREDAIQEIRSIRRPKEINSLFKETIKQRYSADA